MFTYLGIYTVKPPTWLQVDGEGPEDLHDGELVVEGQGQQDAGAKEELNPRKTIWLFRDYDEMKGELI